ncbi:MAG: hypothetical protein MK102_17750 [Fuerstiella sp.]|nr:hypothetical protein [Fuerstiella sp.]
MNRRTSSTSLDSLELLLDTICNTFGAVIFIAMLVALLVNDSVQVVSGTETVQDVVIESARVLNDIQAAKQKLRVLADQIQQQELIKKRFASDESLALTGKLRQQMERRVHLMGQKSDAVEQITQVKGDSARLQQQLDQQQRAYDAADNRNARLRQELSTELELSGRTARIPQVRRTTKDSVVYALDDGRLYRVTTPDQTIDDTDCVRSTEAGVHTIRPRAGAGVPVADRSSGASLNGKFKGVTDEDFFVQLFVSRDSFAAFLSVRDTLVELGLEYEILVTDNNKVELIYGSSERESFVQ